ncbi:MAG: hypothetical protein A3H28_14905 [Acidobacteria bacterium RIFCSPLOWO2_02_FULL_61_28]|nr:MAG: hypothetical protein A3H28_14905 [Acidobacteria bacterium RIFCSPLOWO2_02_FULL_61_28]
MPFLAYYDGSGTHDGSRALILAGFAAPLRIWESFDDGWQKALKRHGQSKLHMREAGVLFNKGNPEAVALIKDLFNVIGSFRQSNFTAYSCSVLLDEYEAAKRVVPTLKAPEAICVDFCVGGLQLTAEDLSEPEPISVYFDTGERFLRHLDSAWRRARKVNPAAGWARQIRHVESVKSDVAAIQAADLFAWLVNRHHGGNGSAFWTASTIIAAKHLSQVYDCECLLKTYDACGMRGDRPAGNPRPLTVNLR